MDCKYCVRIFHPFDEENASWELKEMINWLNDANIKRYRRPSFPHQDGYVSKHYIDKNIRDDFALAGLWRFEDKKDAIAFKMVWGG
jgi:hypothetical protein